MAHFVHFLRGKAKKPLQRHDGQALALFAAGLVGFCGLVGLSIDIGRLVYTATDLQKIADAAALAGSQDLPSTGVATDTATEYGAQNGEAALAISFEESNTVIRVAATRDVEFSFLKVIGLSGQTVTRTAAARGEPIQVTGYNWENTAPFIIWGGARQNMVHAGDQNCPLFTCVGKSYTFLDTNWMNASGKPKLPDWDSSNSNNFKGDIQHGDGAPVNHIGETFSVGGIGSVEVPKPGDILVIPIVDTAKGNSDMRTFHLAAWAVVKVDAGCTKNSCSGTILDPDTTAPPSGWVGGGSQTGPEEFSYTGRDSGLLE